MNRVLDAVVVRSRDPRDGNGPSPMRPCLVVVRDVACLSFTLVALAGCACGGPDVAGRDAAPDALRLDAPLGDAPRADGGPTIEVCADGIRRVEVDLEPLPVPASGTRLEGRSDRLLVVQLYREEEGTPHVARLTVADLDGTVRSTHEVALPVVGNFAPLVIRGDGPYEVFFYQQDRPQFVIAELGEGATPPVVLEVASTLTPFPLGAAAARGGYFVVGGSGPGVSTIVAVDREGVMAQPLDLAVGGGNFESAMTELSASGLVFVTRTGRDGRHGSVTRIDTTTFPFAAATLELEIEPTLFEPNYVSASLVPGGFVAGFGVRDLFEGVRFHWLDENLEVQAALEIETGLLFSHPVGVTGPGPQAVALMATGVGGAWELRAGIAYVPGSIVGGARALVTNVDGYSDAIWTPATGGMSIAYFRGGAPEIVTLCAPP